MRPAAEGPEAGFSLVEVLVAFAVTSLVMIAAFQVFGESAGRLVRAGDRLRQTEEAAALLAALAAEPLVPGSRTGRLGDGTSYRIRVEDAGAALGPHAVGSGTYRVELWVGPPPGRLVLRSVLAGGGGG
ncbi:prepilin-type N-terminal cleavage/methylation domain-containing protein [Methylobacterium durans]|uniref:PulJ/GspJ family protein n=1 Tax=Methylobacterium durans TaxID=2202825 RepID=UPI002AFF0012|nr:prepilin-type N-terminal cleavage/methylation domain-containing protein [Methylobacterium durans]MEA1832117.1 prepilin-type N-terminal cleavage/methylation domain-containing protein [Methylobacterium durans]